MAAGEASRALVYGGMGALGSACVRHLRAKNWWVLSIDLAENQEASANVVVQMGDSFVEQAEQNGLFLICDGTAQQRML